jgi:YD repeat-containing protein
MRKVAILLSGIVLASFLPGFIHAQAIPSQIGPQNATGTQPYEAYGGARENINLANGNLNLQIPLVSLPGRNGHDFSLALNYDSKIWTPSSNYDPTSGQTLYSYDYDDSSTNLVGTVGWRLNVPVLMSTQIQPFNTNPNIYCYGRFVLLTSDGSKHAFFASLPLSGVRTGCYQINSQGQVVQVPQDNVPTGGANDASYLFLDASNSSDIVVRAKDGTTLHFSGYKGSQKPSKIEDTNGNIISIQTNLGSVSSVTDSVGRSIGITWGNPNILVTYKDSAGTQRTITLTLAAQTLTFSWQNPVPGSNPPLSAKLLSSITLPNNLAYSFQYNSVGELIKITYPAGGYTRYDHGVYTNWVQSANPNPPFAADFHEITARHVCRDSHAGCTSATEDTTTYTPTVDGTKTNNQYMDVVSPLGDKTRHQFSFLTSSQAFSNFYSTREIFLYRYRGASTLQRTVQTDYNGLDANGNTTNSSLPIRETMTLNDASPSQISKTEWDYSGVADDVSERREYDFGAGAIGALVRKTDYIWLAVNPVNGQDYTSNSIHILDRKASEQIKDPSGNIYAQTQIEYDNYAANGNIASSGATQHDTAFGTNYVTRANVTATKRWRNTDGAWLSTNNSYDDSGNVLSSTDPAGRTTTYSYADSWGNSTCLPSGGNGAAYVTRVTDALSHISSKKYNSCTGSTASVTDANTQTTTFAYDLINRLIEVDYPTPDGGVTTNTYTDTPGALTLETKQKINSSTWTDRFVLYDGLGRVMASSSANGESTPWDRTDSCYDALGRIQFMSYPFQASSAAAAPNCVGVGDTFSYDALGRSTQVTHSDGTSIITSYTGRARQVQDEGNGTRRVSRVSQIDSLGRLVSICEISSVTLPVGTSNVPASCSQDIAATGFLTTYGYDPLENLTSISQAGLNARNFTYDSLSRLLTATNPESGMVTYKYDSDPNCTSPNSFVGDLVSKVDGHGIRTCMQYDQLHRLTQKNYSDGTPTANIAYDQTSAYGVTLTNTIGRMSSETTASPNPTAKVLSYDQLGRVKNNSQCTPQNCASNTAFPISYAYDLLGNTLSGSNGEGVTISYAYNLAPRLTTVTSSFVDANHPATLFSALHYNAAGAVLTGTLGNALSETRTYDARLRLASVNNGSIYSLTIPSSAGYAPNSDILAANDNVNGNWTYGYDDFNRLLSANATGQAYTYDYDRYGNRWHQNGPHSSQLGFDANNRITGVTGVGYDAAGNTTGDGTTTFTYDAEGRISSSNNTANGLWCNTYNAEGQRVRKTQVTQGTCAAPTQSSAWDFLYDLSGHEIAMISGTGVWKSTRAAATWPPTTTAPPTSSIPTGSAPTACAAQSPAPRIKPAPASPSATTSIAQVPTPPPRTSRANNTSTNPTSTISARATTRPRWADSCLLTGLIHQNRFHMPT